MRGIKWGVHYFSDLLIFPQRNFILSMCKVILCFTIFRFLKSSFCPNNIFNILSNSYLTTNLFLILYFCIIEKLIKNDLMLKSSNQLYIKVTQKCIYISEELVDRIPYFRSHVLLCGNIGAWKRKERAVISFAFGIVGPQREACTTSY